MIIYFERSGGFMGQRVMRTIDVDVLPQETAESLMSLVEKNNYFVMPDNHHPQAMGGMPMYDQFHFKVTIETDQGEKHILETGDQSAPPEMQLFLHELSQLARKPQSVYDAMKVEAETEEACVEFPEDYPPETDYSPDDF